MTHSIQITQLKRGWELSWQRGENPIKQTQRYSTFEAAVDDAKRLKGRNDGS